MYSMPPGTEEDLLLAHRSATESPSEDEPSPVYSMPPGTGEDLPLAHRGVGMRIPHTPCTAADGVAAGAETPMWLKEAWEAHERRPELPQPRRGSAVAQQHGPPPPSWSEVIASCGEAEASSATSAGGELDPYPELGPQEGPEIEP